MAYSRVTHTSDGVGAIKYAKDGTAHNKDKFVKGRVLYSSSLNCTVNGCKGQMMAVWKRFGVDRATRRKLGKKPRREAQRLIQSFDPKQLDYRNPDDIRTVNQIGRATAKLLYPNQQSIVITQADGVGHKLHNHIITNMINFKTGKALHGKSTGWRYTAMMTDKITSHFYNHSGQKLDPLRERDNMFTEAVNGKHWRPASKVKRTSAQYHMKKRSAYSWINDIQSRITGIAKTSTNWNEYVSRCKKHGVTVSAFRKNGKLKKRTSYRFIDKNGKLRRIRNKRLGVMFSPTALPLFFKLTRLRQHKANRQHASAVASQSASVTSASTSASISTSASMASSASASVENEPQPTFNFFRNLHDKPRGAEDTYSQLTIQPNTSNEAKKRNEVHDAYKVDKHDRGLINGFISLVKRSFNEVRQAFRRYRQRLSDWLKRHRLHKFSYGTVHIVTAGTEKLQKQHSDIASQANLAKPKPHKSIAANQTAHNSQEKAIKHVRKLDKELLTTHPKNYQQYIYSYKRFQDIGLDNFDKRNDDPKHHTIYTKYLHKQHEVEENAKSNWIGKRQADTTNHIMAHFRANSPAQKRAFSIIPKSDGPEM